MYRMVLDIRPGSEEEARRLRVRLGEALVNALRGGAAAAEFLAAAEGAPDDDAMIAAAAGAEEQAQLENEREGALLRESYGGRLGHVIEPVIEPLGFDWKIGVGIVGAFAAREVFVSTLGVVYSAGSDVDESSATLRERIRAEVRADGSPVYTPLVGLSLMIFFALACQCMSTLAVVKRETGGYRWPLFLFGYMTTLAWVASFVVYQGGRLLGLG
uniref:nucleoside recognition domain-containing protein n=1 Tax=Haliangium sp. TaxID=2663208 RepID=UPI003D12D834